MIKIKDDDISKIKEILGRVYLENGLTEEVVLLSKALDKLIIVKQRRINERQV